MRFFRSLSDGKIALVYIYIYCDANDKSWVNFATGVYHGIERAWLESLWHIANLGVTLKGGSGRGQGSRTN